MKKKKYPLKFYSIEYECTSYGHAYVKAESDNHAKQIVEDNISEIIDHMDVEEIDEPEISSDAPLLGD